MKKNQKLVINNIIISFHQFLIDILLDRILQFANERQWHKLARWADNTAYKILSWKVLK